MISFLLPSGPLNLATLFPAVDFEQVEEYYLELPAILETPHFRRSECCPCCDDTIIRVFFVNYAGGIDAINLKVITKETDVKSSTWKKGLRHPLLKYDGGLQRTDISAQVIVTARTTEYTEADMEWLEELKATPNAWVQWPGTQLQGADYLPIVVQDGKFLKRKEAERYSYPFELTFTMSNEKILLRN